MTADQFWGLEPGFQCYAAQGGKARMHAFFFRAWRFCFFGLVLSSRSFGFALASAKKARALTSA